MAKFKIGDRVKLSEMGQRHLSKRLVGGIATVTGYLQPLYPQCPTVIWDTAGGTDTLHEDYLEPK